VQLNPEALKALRRAQGYSQETLARRTGISAHSLSRLELGKARARASTIRKLAAALDVPAGAITGHQHPGKPPTNEE
jgi:transcriptional regulator with XRE-family HTH domain